MSNGKTRKKKALNLKVVLNL